MLRYISQYNALETLNIFEYTYTGGTVLYRDGHPPSYYFLHALAPAVTIHVDGHRYFKM